MPPVAPSLLLLMVVVQLAIAATHDCGGGTALLNTLVVSGVTSFSNCVFSSDTDLTQPGFQTLEFTDCSFPSGLLVSGTSTSTVLKFAGQWSISGSSTTGNALQVSGFIASLSIVFDGTGTITAAAMAMSFDAGGFIDKLSIETASTMTSLTVSMPSSAPVSNSEVGFIFVQTAPNMVLITLLRTSITLASSATIHCLSFPDGGVGVATLTDVSVSTSGGGDLTMLSDNVNAQGKSYLLLNATLTRVRVTAAGGQIRVSDMEKRGSVSGSNWLTIADSNLFATTSLAFVKIACRYSGSMNHRLFIVNSNITVRSTSTNLPASQSTGYGAVALFEGNRVQHTNLTVMVKDSIIDVQVPRYAFVICILDSPFGSRLTFVASNVTAFAVATDGSSSGNAALGMFRPDEDAAALTDLTDVLWNFTDVTYVVSSQQTANFFIPSRCNKCRAYATRCRGSITTVPLAQTAIALSFGNTSSGGLMVVDRCNTSVTAGVGVSAAYSCSLACTNNTLLVMRSSVVLVANASVFALAFQDISTNCNWTMLDSSIAAYATINELVTSSVKQGFVPVITSDALGAFVASVGQATDNVTLTVARSTVVMLQYLVQTQLFFAAINMMGSGLLMSLVDSVAIIESYNSQNSGSIVMAHGASWSTMIVQRSHITHRVSGGVSRDLDIGQVGSQSLVLVQDSTIDSAAEATVGYTALVLAAGGDHVSFIMERSNLTIRRPHTVDPDLASAAIVVGFGSDKITGIALYWRLTDCILDIQSQVSAMMVLFNGTIDDMTVIIEQCNVTLNSGHMMLVSPAMTVSRFNFSLSGSNLTMLNNMTQTFNVTQMGSVPLSSFFLGGSVSDSVFRFDNSSIAITDVDDACLVRFAASFTNSHVWFVGCRVAIQNLSPSGGFIAVIQPATLALMFLMPSCTDSTVNVQDSDVTVLSASTTQSALALVFSAVKDNVNCSAFVTTSSIAVSGSGYTAALVVPRVSAGSKLKVVNSNVTVTNAAACATCVSQLLALTGSGLDVAVNVTGSRFALTVQGSTSALVAATASDASMGASSQVSLQGSVFDVTLRGSPSLDLRVMVWNISATSASVEFINLTATVNVSQSGRVTVASIDRSAAVRTFTVVWSRVSIGLYTSQPAVVVALALTQSGGGTATSSLFNVTNSVVTLQANAVLQQSTVLWVDLRQQATQTSVNWVWNKIQQVNAAAGRGACAIVGSTLSDAGSALSLTLTNNILEGCATYLVPPGQLASSIPPVTLLCNRPSKTSRVAAADAWERSIASAVTRATVVPCSLMPSRTQSASFSRNVSQSFSPSEKRSLSVAMTVSNTSSDVSASTEVSASAHSSSATPSASVRYPALTLDVTPAFQPSRRGSLGLVAAEPATWLADDPTTPHFAVEGLANGNDASSRRFYIDVAAEGAVVGRFNQDVARCKIQLDPASPNDQKVSAGTEVGVYLLRIATVVPNATTNNGTRLVVELPPMSSKEVAASSAVDDVNVTVSVAASCLEHAIMPIVRSHSLVMLRPPIPKATVIPQAAKTTASVAVAASSVSGSPGAGMTVARVTIVANIGNCDPGVGEALSFSDSPLGIAIGDEEIGYALGAVVGNMVLLIGFVGAILVAGLVHRVRMGWNTMNRRDVMTYCRLPSVVLMPAGILLEPTFHSAAQCLFYGEYLPFRLIGLAALITIIGVLYIILRYLFNRRRGEFPAVFIPEESPEKPKKHATFMERLKYVGHLTMASKGEWENTHHGNDFVRRYFLFFADFTDVAPWFVIVDLGVALSLSLVDAAQGLLPDGPSCDAAGWVIVSGLAAYMVVMIKLRPFESNFNFLWSAGMLGGQALAAVLTTLGAQSDAIKAAADTLIAVLMYVTVARTFYDIGHLAVGIMRRRLKRLIKLGKENKRLAELFGLASAAQPMLEEVVEVALDEPLLPATVTAVESPDPVEACMYSENTSFEERRLALVGPKVVHSVEKSKAWASNRIAEAEAAAREKQRQYSTVHEALKRARELRQSQRAAMMALPSAIPDTPKPSLPPLPSLHVPLPSASQEAVFHSTPLSSSPPAPSEPLLTLSPPANPATTVVPSVVPSKLSRSIVPLSQLRAEYLRRVEGEACDGAATPDDGSDEAVSPPDGSSASAPHPLINAETFRIFSDI